MCVCSLVCKLDTFVCMFVCVCVYAYMQTNIHAHNQIFGFSLKANVYEYSYILHPYIHTYVHTTYILAYIHTCTQPDLYLPSDCWCLWVFIHAYLNTCTQPIFGCILTHIYMHTTRSSASVWLQTFMSIYTCMHTYIYKCTHKPDLRLPSDCRRLWGRPVLPLTSLWTWLHLRVLAGTRGGGV
jgi:hypothetical protein